MRPRHSCLDGVSIDPDKNRECTSSVPDVASSGYQSDPRSEDEFCSGDESIFSTSSESVGRRGMGSFDIGMSSPSKALHKVA